MHNKDEKPSLLLICHNRLGYLRRTLDNLLRISDDYRLFIWDNNSDTDVSDYIRSLRDDRIEEVVWHAENANQDLPVRWFLDKIDSDFAGKLDDDVLLPDGWTRSVLDVARASPKFGMLGCWIFMQDDFDPLVASQNYRTIGGHEIFAMTGLAGHSFLARSKVLRRYLYPTGWNGHGIPIDRDRMALDGFVSGHPLPMLFAHNMDDPRSEYYIPASDGSLGALTARRLGFKTTEEYARWIRADALCRQAIPFDEQLRALRRRKFFGSVPGKVVQKLFLR